MLEEVSIAKVATYGEQPQRLYDLRQINFLFGTNGSGKTTISRIIADPTEHPSCAVNWRGARPLETLVYNSDFVDRNLTPQLRGIFTLGEVQADTLEKIEAARAKVAEIETQIGTLKTTLGRTITPAASGPSFATCAMHSKNNAGRSRPRMIPIFRAHSQVCAIRARNSVTRC